MMPGAYLDRCTIGISRTIASFQLGLEAYKRVSTKGRLIHPFQIRLYEV